MSQKTPSKDIQLLSLIHLAGVYPENYKIHLATGEHPPLEAYFDGKFKEWQERQNAQNFRCDQILSLIQIGRADWLFVGLFQVLGCRKTGRKHPPYLYQTREIPGLAHLTGRVIVYFERSRASYVWGQKLIDRMVVKEIKPTRLTFGDFTGYDRVALTFEGLSLVVNRELPGWKAALSHVGGVYLIADTRTGKNYVGSAYGEETGIWGRWCKYAECGHGGNTELKALMKRSGMKYCQHFKFTLLEVFDLKTGKDYAIQRETHWKNVLQSRKPFGLNKN